MSLFSEGLYDTPSPNGRVAMSEVGGAGIKEFIGSPDDLKTELQRGIQGSLGDYAQWTTKGLIHAVQDPMAFSVRQRTMGHPYFRNPDDQLVKDNVLGLIAERERQRARMDVIDKSEKLAQLEAIYGENEENRTDDINAAFKNIGAMIDAYNRENTEGVMSPKVRLDALKKWSGDKINHAPGWFFLSKDRMRWEPDSDRKNMEMYDHMPIGDAMKKCREKMKFQATDADGVEREYTPVPFQTMLHMVAGDAFVDGLRLAVIDRYSKANTTASIGAALPKNFQGAATTPAPAATNAMLKVAKKSSKKAATEVKPIAGVFGDVGDWFGKFKFWGKEAPSRDELLVEGSLRDELMSVEGKKPVLAIAVSGPDHVVQLGKIDAAMKANLSGDVHASAIGDSFNEHARFFLKNRTGLDMKNAKWNEATSRFEIAGKAAFIPFRVEPGQHVGAQLMKDGKKVADYSASIYGYKMKPLNGAALAGVPASQQPCMEVALVHLRPSDSNEHPTTMLIGTEKPATCGVHNMHDLMQINSAMSATFPDAKNKEVTNGTGTGVGVDYACQSQNHRGSVKLFTIEQ